MMCMYSRSHATNIKADIPSDIVTPPGPTELLLPSKAHGQHCCHCLLHIEEQALQLYSAVLRGWHQIMLALFQINFHKRKMPASIGPTLVYPGITPQTRQHCC